MKLVTRVKLTGSLLAGVLLTLVSVAANAANTTAGTSIANRATVNYSVGGVSQTAIGSSSTGNTSGAGSDTTFLVDDKLAINVTTVDSAIIHDSSTAPGSTVAVTTYTVTNNGNAVQDALFGYLFESIGTANPFPTPVANSDFAISTAATYVDTNSNGVYDAGTDVATSVISNLAVGASKTVFLVATIPNTQVDGDIAVVGMYGRPGAAGSGTAILTDDSANAWDPATVQNIFAEGTPNTNHDPADAANDGFSTDLSAYEVSSSQLTITKASSVLTDPVHCTTAGSTGSCSGSNFKAIPGSVMLYTVTVANSGSATANASAVSIADDLSTQIPTNLAWFTGGMSVTTPGVNTGSSFACEDDGAGATTQAATGGAPYTAVTCDYNSTTATTVTVSGITLQPGDTATITYEVTIQ